MKKMIRKLKLKAEFTAKLILSEFILKVCEWSMSRFEKMAMWHEYHQAEDLYNEYTLARDSCKVCLRMTNFMVEWNKW